MKTKITFLLFCLLMTGTWLVADPVGTPPAKPKYYQIRNVQFGDLLRPENANSANGTRLVLYPRQPWKCMTWRCRPAGDSAVQLQNLFTSKTFMASTNSVAGLVQAPFAHDPAKNLSWKFTRLPDGAFQITEADSGLALTAVSTADAGEYVKLQAWQATPGQKWELLETDPSQLTM